MKRIVLVSIALLAFATAAFAQPGAVLLWDDLAFTSCDAVSPAGVLTVYVTHEGHPGAKAVQYALSEDTGGSIIYLADVNNFALVIGNSQAGIAVSYGGCVAGQIHVQNVLYSVISNPTACTGITVVPDPAAPSGGIEGVNCADVKVQPNGSFLSFNDDGSCQCGEIVPVEATSWGRLKALYE